MKKKMVRVTERHECKLCSKSFPSGRSLGGHMRSHLATLPLPPKTPQKQETTFSHLPQPQLGGGDDNSSESKTTSSGCSLSREEEEEAVVVQEEKGAVAYGLRENPKKSFRMVDRQVVVVQDRESETESTRKPTRRRSKRTRRLMPAAAAKKQEEVTKETFSMKPMSTTTSAESLLELELNPVSSVVSETHSPEEDLALSLIMLSRDVWRRTSTSDESVEELKLVSSTSKKRQQKKKMRISKFDTSPESSEELELARNVVVKNMSNNLVGQKVHECPFCGKVFGSGQALGGHKRSHFLAASTTISNTNTTTTSASAPLMESSSNSAKSQQGTLLMIDLNLPAPMEDEDYIDNDHHDNQDFTNLLHHTRSREGLCSFRC